MSKETHTYMKRSTLRRVFGSCILSHDILFVSMVLKICRKGATHVRKEMYAKNFCTHILSHDIIYIPKV